MTVADPDPLGAEPLAIDEGARPAVEADLDDLVTLAHRAVDEQGQLRGGALWARREARPVPAERSLVEALGDDERLVVVGTIDDVAVGYGVVAVEPLRDGERLSVVEDLYVEPDGRGVGVGEAVMDLLVGHAEATDCVGIDALALPGDRHTKNFFETFHLTARAIVVHRSLRPTAPAERAVIRPARPGP